MKVESSLANFCPNPNLLTVEIIDQNVSIFNNLFSVKTHFSVDSLVIRSKGFVRRL